MQDMMQTQESQNPWWKSHRWWYWVVLSVVALAGIISIFVVNVNFTKDYLNSQTAPVILPKSESVVIRVVIDFGSYKRAFEGEAKSGMTVASALGEIADLAKLNLEIRQNSLVTLNGKKLGRSGTRWNIYLNGALGDAKILTHALKGGDRLMLRYE